MFQCPAAAVAGFGGSIMAEMPTRSLTTVSRPYCFSCMTTGFPGVLPEWRARSAFPTRRPEAAGGWRTMIFSLFSVWNR
jgi:hypothetical protein